jgi:hypothetical protein
MVECDWQDKTDYGQKYSIGIYTQGPSKEWVIKSKRTPNRYWFYKAKGCDVVKEDIELEPVKFKVPTLMLRNSVYKWQSYIGKHPSRGTAAIVASLEHLRPNSITAVGFDAVIRGFDDNHHPQALTDYIGREPKKGGDTHNWEGERELLRILKMKYVNIRMI